MHTSLVRSSEEEHNLLWGVKIEMTPYAHIRGHGRTYMSQLFKTCSLAACHAFEVGGPTSAVGFKCRCTHGGETAR